MQSGILIRSPPSAQWNYFFILCVLEVGEYLIKVIASYYKRKRKMPKVGWVYSISFFCRNRNIFGFKLKYVNIKYLVFIAFEINLVEKH